MKRKTIIKKLSSMLFLAALFFANFSLATANVNYGTTTFFSGTENAVPPVSQPILDSGGESNPKWKPSDKKDDQDEAESPESIFEKITDKFQSFLGNATTQTSVDVANDGSLFDFQKEGNENDGSLDGEWDWNIMGPRGESLDGGATDEYENKFAQNFNFGNEKKDAPKKSKLLFTNIDLSIDLTTQYVIIGLVFFFAIGLSVGYYFWKKEARLADKKYNSDDDL